MNVSRKPSAEPTAPPRRRRLWPAFVVTALLVVAVALYAVWPRHPDLTAFEPSTMAQLETSMWRAYYEKRYLALFRDLYSVSRD